MFRRTDSRRPALVGDFPEIVERMFNADDQMLALAERLIEGEPVEVFGFSLFRRLGVDYRAHARHFRCRIMPDGSFDEAWCARQRVDIDQ